MNEDSQHEKTLHCINEIQKKLDEIFAYVDDNTVSKLKLGMILRNLSNSDTWVKQAHDYLIE